MERTHRIRILSFLTIVLFFSISTHAAGTEETTSIQPLSSQPITIDSSQSLQESIRTAAPNTTIQLAAGTYNEILTINKPLHLKGQGATQTFLVANSSMNGYAIHIIVPGVIISELTITNTGPGLYATGIKISAPNTIVQNCLFEDTSIGIALWSSQNSISDCDFSGCSDEGIVLLGTSTSLCTNNTIVSCVFTENCDGIELQYATHNTITSCVFTKNTHAGIDAILSQNNYNVIATCTFSDNAGFGLYLAGSYDTLISQCSFSDDTISFVHAVNNTLQKSQTSHLQLMDSSSLLIRDCNGINTSDITTIQSTYEIRPGQPRYLILEKTPHFPPIYTVLLSLLSRFKNLKSFYERFRQIRM
jgi:parallel beta-helix repeat protein